jgi:hypothetical protein
MQHGSNGAQTQQQKGRSEFLPSLCGIEGDMNYQTLFRNTILTISAAAMVVGILVMVGALVPRNFPGQYGILIGAVVFLYGAYRFAVTYFKRTD